MQTQTQTSSVNKALCNNQGQTTLNKLPDSQPHLGSTHAEWFTLANPPPHIVYKYIYKQIISTNQSHSHKAVFTPSEREREIFL